MSDKKYAVVVAIAKAMFVVVLMFMILSTVTMTAAIINHFTGDSQPQSFPSRVDEGLGISHVEVVEDGWKLVVQTRTTELLYEKDERGYSITGNNRDGYQVWIKHVIPYAYPEDAISEVHSLMKFNYPSTMEEHVHGKGH
jgi:hypothetical protein